MMITTCEDYITASRELAALHLIGNALLIVGAAVLFRFLVDAMTSPWPAESEDAGEPTRWQRLKAWLRVDIGEAVAFTLIIPCVIAILVASVFFYSDLVDLIAPLNSHSAIEFCNQLDGLAKAGGVK